MPALPSRTRKGVEGDFGGAGLLKDPGQGVGRAAGGDYVVRHAHVQAVEAVPARERALEVGAACAAAEAALGGGGAGSAHRVAGQWCTEAPADLAGDFTRLVEPSRGQPPPVQGHGKNEIRGRGRAHGEVFTEGEREGAAVGQVGTELEAVQQAVDGPAVVERGIGGIEVRGLSRAVAADPARQRRQRLGTPDAGVIVPRQVAETRRAEVRVPTLPAQQATRCGEMQKPVREVPWFAEKQGLEYHFQD